MESASDRKRKKTGTQNTNRDRERVCVRGREESVPQLNRAQM